MKSKFLSTVLTLCMIITMMPSMIFAQDNLSDGDIVILHTNDTHSRVDDNLGFSSVKAWKDYFVNKGNDVLLLDAGDTLHGLPVANLSNGENIVEIMNEVGYDAMTAGNHDYNYGINQLINLKNQMKFDLLIANVTKDGQNTFTSSKVYEKGNKKIGVLGISTPETATKTNPANVVGYSFNADKLVKIVQNEIDNLKSQGADYIVALGHLGIDSESSPYMSTEIISQVENLDIFIDGHSHSQLPNGQIVKDKNNKDVVLAQTGNYLNDLGEVVIKEDGTIKASLITEKKSDENIDNLVNSMKAEIQTELDKVVGYTSVLLDGSRDPGVRTKETNLGNLVADALKYVSGADVALTNGGGIRTSVDVGEITYGELNAVLPFGNIVTKIQVTGKQIVDALEHGTSAVPGASGGFPQVSGITYEIHSYLTENRVKNVKINGENVDLNKTYTLATNDFTAVGGDGYDMFKNTPKLGEYTALDEALVAYIKQMPNGTVGEEYATEQGRIKIFDTEVEEGNQDQDNNENTDVEEGNQDQDNNQDTDVEEVNQDQDNNENADVEEGNQGQDNNENADAEEGNQDQDNNENTDVEEGNTTSPQTGDEQLLVTYVAMAVVSMAVLGCVVINKRKYANKK